MSDPDRPADTSILRRQVLAAAGTALVPLAASVPVSAQQTTDDPVGTETESPSDGEIRTESRALIIPPDNWDEAVGTLDGAFVHAGGEVSPAEAAGSDRCDYADWPDDTSRAYDVMVISREELRETVQPTTLYVPNEFDVPPGGLYIIERVEPCPSAYRGIYIRQLGIKNLSLEEGGTGDGADDADDGTSGTGSPGFGVLGAFTALVGASALSNYLSGDG